MGCFCREAVQALHEEPDTTTDPPGPEDPPPQDELLHAVDTWLATRLLPAPPWQPDETWLETVVPDPPMPPESLGVLIALVQAYQSAAALGVDLVQPNQLPKLARIVGTLNRRLPILDDWLEQDQQPWEQLATLNDQADTVIAAVKQDVFRPTEAQEDAEPDLAPWRPLIRRVKALTPLVAIGQLLPGTAGPEPLAELVRALRRVVLPPLDNPMLVLRVIARTGALSRLQTSFGVDPRRTPFQRVERAVARKVEQAKQLLPEDARVQDGVVQGLPARQPNPTQILNEDTIAAVEKLTPEALDRLRWNPPPYDQFDILTAGAPAMTLARIMTTLGPPAIRTSPCNRNCDAAAVSREQAASPAT